MSCKLALAVCLLFLCFESSFAGVARASSRDQQQRSLIAQPTPQNALSPLFDILKDPQTQDIMSALVRLYTLHQNGELEFENYLKKHPEEFDVAKVEEKLEEQVNRNITSLRTIALKLLPNHTHATNWTLVDSAWHKLENGGLFDFHEFQHRRNLTSNSSLDAVNFPSVSHKIANLYNESLLCGPSDENGCATKFKVSYTLEGLVAGLTLAKTELTGQFHLVSLAIKGALNPETLTVDDELFLEDSIPGIKRLNVLRYESSGHHEESPTESDREDDDEDTSRLEVEPDPNEHLNSEPKLYRFVPGEKMTGKKRALLLILTLGSILDDLVPVGFAFLIGVADGMTPVDSRPWVADVGMSCFIIVTVFLVITLALSIFDDSALKERIKRTHGFDSWKGPLYMTIASLTITCGFWYSFWGTFKEISFDSGETKKSIKITGMVLFALGMIMYLHLCYKRSVMVQQDSIRAFKESKRRISPKSFRIAALVLGSLCLIGSMVLFYQPLLSQDPDKDMDNGVFGKMVGFMILLSISLVLLGNFGFRAFQPDGEQLAAQEGVENAEVDGAAHPPGHVDEQGNHHNYSVHVHKGINNVSK